MSLPATRAGVCAAAGVPAGAANNPEASSARAGSCGPAGMKSTAAGPNQRQPHQASTTASRAAAAMMARPARIATAREPNADGAAAVTKDRRPLAAHRYNRPFPARNLRVNPRLALLQPYPFERLRALFDGVTPDPAKRAISLAIGEPRHPTPRVVLDALAAGGPGIANYPTTMGSSALRETIAGWLARRHGLPLLDPATQVLPVLGSREALFAFAQAVVDGSRPDATVVVPNPFYQIYEGAALLRPSPMTGAVSRRTSGRARNSSTSARRTIPPAASSVWTSGACCSRCPTATAS